MLTIIPLITGIALSSTTALAPADTIPVDTVSQKFTDNLEELVVTAKKKVIKSDGATLTYDLREDTSSKGATLLDALKKVPMITVDGQDKIMINGDSNFKIFVNGKEEPMLEANYDKIFKSMPADAFSKIEVITEPGAKFDAEGTGGILNLITETKQTSKDGYTGSITGSLSNRESGVSLFGRAKYGNFNIDANVNYAATAISDQDQKSHMETIDYNNSQAYKLVREQVQKTGFHFISSTLNASWSPDDHNIFSFGGSYTGINAKIKKMDQHTNMFDTEGNRQWGYSQYFKGNLKMNSASANASYQHDFKDSGKFTLAYLFNFGKTPLHINSVNEADYNFSFPFAYSFNNMDNYTREHTVQIDYSTPFGGEKHLLETGGKMILRLNSAYSTQGSGTSADNMISDDAGNVFMNQMQNIYALYASYTGHFGAWTAKAGVRYEHTDMGIKYLKGDPRKTWSNLDDVVPNAALTYSFSPMSNLRLAYQMRISRPSIQQMSPFQVNIMENIVQLGNPDLTSQKNNKVSLTYTNFGRVLGGNIGVEYSQTDNAIESYEYWIGQTQYSTYANIGNNKSIALQGFLNINISPRMTMSVNGRVAYVSLKSTSPDYSNHGWTGNYGANWSYTAPGDIKLSLYGGQNVHNVNLQGHFSGFYYYGLGISRDFLKNKSLNLALNASNIFSKYSSFKSYTYTKTHYNYNNFQNQQWRVGVSLTWKFGHLSAPAKKVQLQIDNDDKVSTDNGQGAKGGIGL